MDKNERKSRKKVDGILSTFKLSHVFSTFNEKLMIYLCLELFEARFSLVAVIF